MLVNNPNDNPKEDYMEEKEMDPKSFSGFEEFVPGKEYIVVFNVTNRLKRAGYKTTGGALYEHASNNPEEPYGTFKLSTVYKNRGWAHIDYGPALDAAYGLEDGQHISGLFVRITNDFGPNEMGLAFATAIWEARDHGFSYNGQALPPQAMQVRVRIRIPNESGTIIQQVYRGDLQIVHRVQMVGEPIFMPISDPMAVTVSDEDVELVMDDYFESIPVRPLKDREKVVVTTRNALHFTRVSRSAAQPQATKNQAEFVPVRPSLSQSAQQQAQQRPQAPEYNTGLIAEMDLTNKGELHGRQFAEFAFENPEEDEDEE